MYSLLRTYTPLHSCTLGSFRGIMVL